MPLWRNDCGCIYRYGLGGEEVVPCAEKHNIHMDEQTARKAILLNLFRAAEKLLHEYTQHR